MLRDQAQTSCTQCYRPEEAGNVLIYILIAVVLFAALSASLMSGGQDSAVAQSSLRLSQAIQSQAQGIRSGILECVLVYQDAGYPTTPGSNLAEDVQCVSPSSGTFDIFKGFQGNFMPEPPRPFNDWVYNNDAAGTIYIAISTPGANADDPGVIDALDTLETKFTADEATIVNTGVAASFTLYLTKP